MGKVYTVEDVLEPAEGKIVLTAEDLLGRWGMAGKERTFFSQLAV